MNKRSPHQTRSPSVCKKGIAAVLRDVKMPTKQQNPYSPTPTVETPLEVDSYSMRTARCASDKISCDSSDGIVRSTSLVTSAWQMMNMQFCQYRKAQKQQEDKPTSEASQEGGSALLMRHDLGQVQHPKEAPNEKWIKNYETGMPASNSNVASCQQQAVARGRSTYQGNGPVYNRQEQPTDRRQHSHNKGKSACGARGADCSTEQLIERLEARAYGTDRVKLHEWHRTAGACKEISEDKVLEFDMHNVPTVALDATEQSEMTLTCGGFTKSVATQLLSMSTGKLTIAGARDKDFVAARARDKDLVAALARDKDLVAALARDKDLIAALARDKDLVAARGRDKDLGAAGDRDKDLGAAGDWDKDLGAAGVRDKKSLGTAGDRDEDLGAAGDWDKDIGAAGDRDKKSLGAAAKPVAAKDSCNAVRRQQRYGKTAEQQQLSAPATENTSGIRASECGHNTAGQDYQTGRSQWANCSVLSLVGSEAPAVARFSCGKSMSGTDRRALGVCNCSPLTASGGQNETIAPSDKMTKCFSSGATRPERMTTSCTFEDERTMTVDLGSVDMACTCTCARHDKSTTGKTEHVNDDGDTNFCTCSYAGKGEQRCQGSSRPNRCGRLRTPELCRRTVTTRTVASTSSGGASATAAEVEWKEAATSKARRQASVHRHYNDVSDSDRTTYDFRSNRSARSRGSQASARSRRTKSRNRGKTVQHSVGPKLQPRKPQKQQKPQEKPCKQVKQKKQKQKKSARRHSRES